MATVNRRTFITLAGLSMAASSLGFPRKGMAQTPTAKRPFRKICVEEHFSTTDHLDYLSSIYKKTYPIAEVVQEEKYILADVPFLPYLFLRPPLVAQLCDLSEGRLEEMDKCGIDVQVLSLLSPGVQVFEASTATRLSIQYNDRLAAAAKNQPKRFVGLACLAPQDPKQAADELERAVKNLGFKGAIINSHTKGEYLDDKKYWVIFEKAEKLNVPIYLHPRGPSPDMMTPFIGYPLLDSAMWGFGAEAGLHSLRLILSGLFDEFPRLKIILGHLGETIPFVLARIDNRWSALPFFAKSDFPFFGKKPKKLPGQYFRDNFLVTTSGMNEDPATLIAALSILGADSILLATDYPMEDAWQAVSFIDNVPISDQEKAKICHLNAERVFSL